VASKKKGFKRNAIQVPVPQTREQAEKLLMEIGLLQAKAGGYQVKCDERVASVRQAFAELVAPVNDDIEAKFQALATYAESHRGELLKGNAKSVKLATGVLEWRFNPPSIGLTKVAEVLKQLKAKGLTQYIRITEEVDKEALLKAGETKVGELGIKGIKFNRVEQFAATPDETHLERVATVKVAGGRK
jgi:phage host-nuclease inhibitor protein Gam